MVIFEFFGPENCQTASEFILICRLNIQYLTHTCNPEYRRMLSSYGSTKYIDLRFCVNEKKTLLLFI